MGVDMGSGWVLGGVGNPVQASTLIFLNVLNFGLE